jgi:hypothetical protein
VFIFLHQIVPLCVICPLSLVRFMGQISRFHTFTRHYASSTQVWLLVTDIIMFWCFRRKICIVSISSKLLPFLFSKPIKWWPRVLLNIPLCNPVGLQDWSFLGMCRSLVMHHLKVKNTECVKTQMSFYDVWMLHYFWMDTSAGDEHWSLNQLISEACVHLICYIK